MIPTVFEQTGWKGAMSVTICQDLEVLRRITQYDYNCSDKAFMQEVEDRGIMGRMLDMEFCANYSLTKEDYMSREHPVADPEPGEAPSDYAFSTEEIEFFWTIVLAARGSLQDCWEMHAFRR